MKFSNFYLIDNSLVKNRVSLIRDKNCSIPQFRDFVEDLSIFLCYEACKDLKLIVKKIETPLEETDGFSLGPVFFVAVLRAGLGMVPGALKCVPYATVGNVGMFRNEETLKPVRYYCNLPKNISDGPVFILDPMLATGGSMCDAIDVVKEHKATSITCLCLISAPEGIKKVNEKHPDVKIYSASLDRELNSKGYIMPGLGDAGDRIFGTL